VHRTGRAIGGRGRHAQTLTADKAC
jgi:hypothetical protein